MLPFAQRDLDTSMFLRSFARKPLKNINSLLKLINFIVFLFINRLFSFLKIDFSKLKKIKFLYLISLLSRAKYLKWNYFSSSLINNCELNKNWYLDLPSIGYGMNVDSNKFYNIDNIKLASKKINFVDK